MTYVAHYYYNYFTRVNPLPGPFPFPLIGNVPQIYLLFYGDAQMFYDYCYEKYGNIHEIYDCDRSIILCRREYLENFLSLSEKNAHWMRFNNSIKPEEFGTKGKGILFNNNFKSWVFNRQFFSQAILSPKFTDEAIDWINKLFDELESYWNKLFLEEIIKENKVQLDFSGWFNNFTNDIIISLLTGEKYYSMAAYFTTLSDEKSQSAMINDSVKLAQALRKQLLGVSFFLFIPSFLRNYIPFFKNKANDILNNMGFLNQRLDAIIKRRRNEIDNTSLDESLPHDMLTSMIIKNTPRDDNYFETGEANRSMTDSEIRVNLLEGIITGTHKIREILILGFFYTVNF
ncbi:hypothetical protein RirG_087510 [Rhizophagus irregularis DAOM 197198w]|nr:hypothetical protein RirG_087510 [Rhizophagus irregularis DAOM 197198w]